MTSLLSGTKQNSSEGGFFIPVASLVGQIYGRTEPNPAGANTGVNGGSFSTAQWANWGSKTTSSIGSAGAGVLRDMGRTVVSSLRTFRKVQLVIPNSVSTFGVSSPAVASAAIPRSAASRLRLPMPVTATVER